MNEVYYIEGGKKIGGEIWGKYISKYDGAGLSNQGSKTSLAMEEEHFINAALRKPGETRKGIVAILTEEEVEFLKSRNK